MSKLNDIEVASATRPDIGLAEDFDPEEGNGYSGTTKEGGGKHSTIDNTTDFGEEREKFFAFIPSMARWACGIVGKEVTTAKNAIVGFPSWSAEFGKSTVVFYKKNPKVLYKEIISGFTVAIMQVPESIAFSFVAGVPPVSGLHATFWMATITGIFGGKPGMISGAAGALAVVATDLTKDDGVLSYLAKNERLEVLYMTMFTCGIMQIFFAWFRLAKLVRLIPETGMIGFMNGLAIIIFMAQLPAFQYCTAELLFVECSVDQRQWLTFQDNTWQLILTLVHVFGCMFIMQFFRYIPYVGKIIPASLVALLIGTLIEHTLFRMAFGVATRTVGDTTVMSGDWPRFNWPNNFPQSTQTTGIIISYGLTLAAIGSVESVLTLQACNEITDTVPKIRDSNQELFAQGLGNLASGLFSAMGGDAMIGQSTINIMNGARHRVSSTCSGLFMLLFVIAISGFIELLPIATLTGVLFMVVVSTFQWSTFNILRYGRLSDSGVILIVTLVAVFFNLAIAIAAGVIFSALVHAWDSGACVDADITKTQMLVNGEECTVKYVRLKGSIFFGSARHFIALFSVANDPSTVVIDFQDALIIDHSAVAAIQGIQHRFAKAGKRVLLTNLPHKSAGRLNRTGDQTTIRETVHEESSFQDVIISNDDETNNGNDETTEDETEQKTTEDEMEHHIKRVTQMAAEDGLRPHNLGELPMFHASVTNADSAMSRLSKEQGNVSIHQKDQ
jgi:SulP family sulfate permease